VTVVDSGYYESQRRGVEEEYGANMATNAYARTLSQQRGNRNLGLMRTGFERSVPGFSAGFGQRGFGGGGVNSGVVQRSMSNFLGDFTRDYSSAQNDLTEQLRGYDLQSAQLGSQRTSALADIELAKAREVAFAAQNIEALRSLLGGV
jgi:hypothetical protein